MQFNESVTAAMGALGALFATTAHAENLTFSIVNDSNYIISSFQANEGNGWSNNWLRGELRAGQKIGMKFLHDGPCDIQVRVGWRTTDGGQQISKPWNIDICDAHTVYFDGNKVTYD